MSFEVQHAAAFLPQQDPFVMIDRLLYADENGSRAGFRIKDDNFFLRRGFFSTAGMIESMAQTAAAGTGWLHHIQKKPVPVGYIGAVQKLEVQGWAPAGSEIEMDVSTITRVMQVSLVSCIVRQEDKILASCEMKIFINPTV